MKIRSGFVSNSSTSSFVLVGTDITEEQAKKISPELFEKDGENELVFVMSLSDKFAVKRFYDRFFIGKVIRHVDRDGNYNVDDTDYDMGVIVDAVRDAAKKAGIIPGKIHEIRGSYDS
jgi:hypothetical protein